VGGRAGAALDAARELVRKVDREVEPLAASVGTAFDDAGRLVRNVDREVEPSRRAYWLRHQGYGVPT
jgi:hypothetical protein